MTKRIVIGIICILLLGVFFVGCANTEATPTPTPTPRVTNTPKTEAQNTDAMPTQPIATPDVTEGGMTDTVPDTSPAMSPEATAAVG